MSSPSPSKAKPRRWVVPALAGFVMLLIIGLLGVGWVGSERAIHPARAHYPGPAEFPDLHPQPITFDSRTHTRIAAEFFPGEKHATIVLSHGYGDNQAQMLPYAQFLHNDGFSVLTYDMRNRGESGGDAVTLGAPGRGSRAHRSPRSVAGRIDHATRHRRRSADQGRRGR